VSAEFSDVAIATAAKMLSALADCPAAERLDALAVVAKVVIERADLAAAVTDVRAPSKLDLPPPPAPPFEPKPSEPPRGYSAVIDEAADWARDARRAARNLPGVHRVPASELAAQADLVERLVARIRNLERTVGTVSQADDVERAFDHEALLSILRERAPRHMIDGELNVAALRGEILETVEGVDTGELEEALSELVYERRPRGTP
jgi:hypothetical protein